MMIAYVCPSHGLFEAKQPVGRWRVYMACPECGTKSTATRTLRKPGDNGIPQTRGDVRSQYFSENLNQWVGSRRDINEAYRRLEVETGYHPLSQRDIKTGIENARNRRTQAIADVKWLENQKNVSIERGDAPSEEIITGR